MIGTGSHSRRKRIIGSAVGRTHLFGDLLKQFKKAFGLQADMFQQTLKDVAQCHLASLKLTLDLIRMDNVILESEKDPEFRARVEAGVNLAKADMRRLVESLSE